MARKPPKARAGGTYYSRRSTRGRFIKANEQYVEKLARELNQVPQVAALLLGIDFYTKVVEKTLIDSGQAAMNWHIGVFSGSADYETQQMFWGYGGKKSAHVAPTLPAGYKWQGSDAHSEAVRSELIEKAALLQVEYEDTFFTRVVVYNPIEPGFAGFAPMTPDDLRYAENAFGYVTNMEFMGEAISVMQEKMSRRFHFVTPR